MFCEVEHIDQEAEQVQPGSYCGQPFAAARFQCPIQQPVEKQELNRDHKIVIEVLVRYVVTNEILTEYIGGYYI